VFNAVFQFATCFKVIQGAENKFGVGHGSHLRNDIFISNAENGYGARIDESRYGWSCHKRNVSVHRVEMTKVRFIASGYSFAGSRRCKAPGKQAYEGTSTAWEQSRCGTL
jgi:hypothetical protein